MRLVLTAALALSCAAGWAKTYEYPVAGLTVKSDYELTEAERRDLARFIARWPELVSSFVQANPTAKPRDTYPTVIWLFETPKAMAKWRKEPEKNAAGCQRVGCCNLKGDWIACGLKIDYEVLSHELGHHIFNTASEELADAFAAHATKVLAK